MAPNLLFIYLRQNSHIHIFPSGILAYSSGNGASYQVLMSYCPKRILCILSTPGSNLGRAASDPPGVEGPGELPNEKSNSEPVMLRLGTGVELWICCNVTERRGRGRPPVVNSSGRSNVRDDDDAVRGGGAAIFSCLIRLDIRNQHQARTLNRLSPQQ